MISPLAVLPTRPISAPARLMGPLDVALFSRTAERPAATVIGSAVVTPVAISSRPVPVTVVLPVARPKAALFARAIDPAETVVTPA